jgi:hypothetical protein
MAHGKGKFILKDENIRSRILRLVKRPVNYEKVNAA